MMLSGEKLKPKLKIDIPKISENLHSSLLVLAINVQALFLLLSKLYFVLLYFVEIVLGKLNKLVQLIQEKLFWSFFIIILLEKLVQWP